MSRRTYKPAKARLIVVILLMITVLFACIAGALKAGKLLSHALDGRRIRTQATEHLSEFALRAQMYSGQAESRVSGWLTVVGNETISLKADNITLHARRFDPVGGTDHAPWALVLHGGLGTEGRNLMDVACELSLAGYRVLLPDLRAHGQSGGQLSSLGIRESDDVAAWIDWIYMCQPDTRIVVYGQDEGAVAALLAAGRLEGKICAAAADGAYSSVGERAKQMLEETAGQIDAAGRILFDLAYRSVFGTDADQGDVLSAVKNSSVPLLLIHGTGDEDVQAWHSEDLANAAGERAQLLLIENAAHGKARFIEPKVYYDRLLSFFEAAL